ncbi:MAG: hypothetical protein ACTSU9_01810 [Promethearchaeota archaeon]
MLDLNNITVANLKNLAKKLGIKLKGRVKNDYIQEIMNSGVDSTLLEKEASAFIKKKSRATKRPKKVTTGSAKTPLSPSTKKIEARFANIEHQIKFIMEKISSLESLIQSSGKAPRRSSVQEIKVVMKKLIPHGKSVNIDSLLKAKEMMKFDRNSTERAILELIDDEVFDASESSSKEKIDGYIGRIIRR